MQGDSSVNFQNYWISNKRLPSECEVMQNQIVRQPEQAVCFDLVYQICEYIQNQRTGLKLFTIVLYKNTQIIQSPIANYCLTFYLDVHAETQLVPKLLLHVYIQELRNIMVIPP